MDRVLVTGGAGFIGSHLVDRLVEEGYNVRVLDNFDPQVHHGTKPSYLNKHAEYQEGDIRDEAALKKALGGIDYIYHFAAKVGVGQSMYEIKDYVSVNTFGTAVLWDHIVNQKVRVKKIVVASSMSIYGEGAYRCVSCGDQTPHLRAEESLKQKQWDLECPSCRKRLDNIPTAETKKLLATSIYAISKKDQEEISLILGRSYALPTVALRFFNVYGKRQSLSNPYTGACAIFSSRIKNDNPPLIYEDGLQTRDFIDVRDIVEANLLVLKDRRADYRALNVGTGIPNSIHEVAETLIRLYGKTFKPEIVHRFRAGDIRHCYADVTRLKELGFKPRYSLESGLRDLVAWGKTEEAVDTVAEADKTLEKYRLKI
ncbi:MAG: SDR family NAD(P)-dependent oxidoreductase [Candidatus Omnitrophica bacterium]|nr:SDR family NAD(P)-dependent oxidoreductase [Candidatus Omnitrophota bacterium]